METTCVFRSLLVHKSRAGCTVGSGTIRWRLSLNPLRSLHDFGMFAMWRFDRWNCASATRRVPTSSCGQDLKVRGQERQNTSYCLCVCVCVPLSQRGGRYIFHIPGVSFAGRSSLSGLGWDQASHPTCLTAGALS